MKPDDELPEIGKQARTEFDESVFESGPPNTEFIERCQLEYERRPSSRIFAPLAEGYRRLQMLDEAYDVASRGVRQHPDFAAGRIAFARILIEKQAYADAVDQLVKATTLSPDNILAYLLLGDSLMKLRRPNEALKAYKMVLFLNPSHERAMGMVKKWEFLTAEEFENDVFEWSANKLPPTPAQDRANSTQLERKPYADREANRAISVADALTVRNDTEGALAHIGRAIRELGLRPDLEHRLQILAKRMQMTPEEAFHLAVGPARKPSLQTSTKATNPDVPTDSSSPQEKRKRLQNLLKKMQRQPGGN